MHAIILEWGRGSGIFFFDEMQNGAIWGHFRVSYNIESSTILMTLIDKNFLKLSKFCPSCFSRYELLHCFAQIHFKIKSRLICINSREDTPAGTTTLKQRWKLVVTLNNQNSTLFQRYNFYVEFATLNLRWYYVVGTTLKTATLYQRWTSNLLSSKGVNY